MLSLFFCLATVALWVRSYSVCDVLYSFDGNGGEQGARSSGGGIFVYSYPADFPHFHSPYHYVRIRPKPWLTRRGAATFFGGVTGIRRKDFELGFPHWALLVLFAMIPGSHALSLLRRPSFRSTFGYCPVCGYDLRATPERCPECGLRRII